MLTPWTTGATAPACTAHAVHSCPRHEAERAPPRRLHVVLARPPLEQRTGPWPERGRFGSDSPCATSRGGQTVHVHGFCDDRFRELESVFRSNLAQDSYKGASLAVALHGTPVVDVWGGWRDAALALPWEADTVVRVFSTSKVPVITAVLMVVDRGLLDLDAP